MTFLSPSWRSLNLGKGHLTIPKRSPEELPGGYSPVYCKGYKFMAGWEADYEMSSWRTWFPATVKRQIPMIRFPRGIWWDHLWIRCHSKIGRFKIHTKRIKKVHPPQKKIGDFLSHYWFSWWKFHMWVWGWNSYEIDTRLWRYVFSFELMVGFLLRHDSKVHHEI